MLLLTEFERLSILSRLLPLVTVFIFVGSASVTVMVSWFAVAAKVVCCRAKVVFYWALFREDFK